MLKLKRVDIHGFKSFYDRTEMRFHGSGIAAIVGPNGCGKSNLSDAISWVLGEQSAKSLRGARMEDVIFAGTREKKPLGMAQVTLTMADPAAHAPISHEIPQNGHSNGHVKHEDVTITRRLYRSGESEYLINGHHARLRDIQDLFSGTGLGPESYAIIEQGRIGQILSNRPADRRAIIEEAAGIGKYKTRKRLAEAKLESARQNLSRVFDILEEVGRQVNSLKRQASKARRYEELRTEMVAHLRRAVAGRFQMLEREAAKLALDLNQAQSSYQSLSTSVQEQEQEYTRRQESCYRTESELTAARSTVAELNLESERTRGRLELQAKQIGAIDERLAAGDGETQELDARRERESAALDVHHAAVAAIDQEGESLRVRLDQKTKERDAVQNDLRGREHLIEQSRQQVLRLLGEASTLRNQLAQIDEYLAAIERDSARSRKEEETALSDLARLEQVKAELSEKLAARQMELESLGDRRRRVEEEMKERQTRATGVRQKLDEMRNTLSRQKARKDSLEEILSHRAYTTESVKRLFLGLEHGRIEGFKPSGVLADFVEVADTAWEKACEEFLHEELEYVVVSGWAEAERGVELMRADSDGRATFLVHPETSAASPLAPDLSAQPGVVGRLRDTLRLTNGFAQAPQGLLPRLARCFLVSDRATAQALATANPDCYLPASGRRELSRPRGQRRAQVGGRSAGTEARIARTERAGGSPAARDGRSDRGARRIAARNGAARRRAGSGAGAAADAGERRARVGSRAAQIGRGKRAGRFAAVGGAAGSWNGRPARVSGPVRSASRARRWWPKKSRRGSIRKKLWKRLAGRSVSYRRMRMASAKSIRRCGRNWRGSTSARDRKKARWRAWKRKFFN